MAPHTRYYLLIALACLQTVMWTQRTLSVGSHKEIQGWCFSSNLIREVGIAIDARQAIARWTIVGSEIEKKAVRCVRTDKSNEGMIDCATEQKSGRTSLCTWNSSVKAYMYWKTVGHNGQGTGQVRKRSIENNGNCSRASCEKKLTVLLGQ